jgi:hypothetical protein
MIDPNLAQELALIVEYGKLRKPSMSVTTDPIAGHAAPPVYLSMFDPLLVKRAVQRFHTINSLERTQPQRPNTSTIGLLRRSAGNR